MSRYWSKVVHALTPYVPGEQPKRTNLVKLNTNENPYGPSPKVLAAIQEATSETLRLYPDPNADRLREAIAECFAPGELSPRQVFVGNGSDEVLALVFLALLKHEKPLLFPDITYSFYPVYCGLHGITYERIPLDEAFQIRMEDYDRPCGGIIFPNPNAPTGRWLGLDAIEGLLASHPDCPVVIDEAYVDFGCESAVGLVIPPPQPPGHPHPVQGPLAGGTPPGFAIGHPDLVEALDRVKNSFQLLSRRSPGHWPGRSPPWRTGNTSNGRGAPSWTAGSAWWRVWNTWASRSCPPSPTSSSRGTPAGMEAASTPTSGSGASSSATSASRGSSSSCGSP